MPNKPSKIEHEVYVFVGEFNDENGFSPSLRDIQRQFNWKSVSTAANHVDNLVLKGLLRKIKNHARTLEVVPLDEKETSSVTREDHLDWLRKEAARYAIDSHEVEVLQQALKILEVPRKSHSDT